MLKYLMLCVLAAHTICAKPVPVVGEVPSHIVIVTPQAQVRLEPALKYDTPATIIHHLAPLARIGAPHEETIVYVPASAAAPIIPLESVSVGRSGGNAQVLPKSGAETKQYDQISQQIQQAIQTGSSMIAPALSEAASMAGAAAASAGQGFFPALFPPSQGASEGGSKDEAKPLATASKIIYETPAATETLLPANARLYAIAPAVSHVIDFGHAPVFVGPLSAVRARSIQEAEALAEKQPLAALPLEEAAAPAPDALPLKEERLPEKELPLPAEEKEKKSEFGRFLEANALKEEKKELEGEKQQPELQQLEKKDELKEPLPLKEPLIEEPAPQLKSVAPVVDVNAVEVPKIVAVVPEEVVVVPQVKVA